MANQVVFAVTGTVALNAPNPMSNTATVAVPAAWIDSVAGNNSSQANVAVIAPDLIVSKSHTPDPMARGSTSGVYSIVVKNIGTAATLTDPAFNTVTVTDTLPAGLTPTTASGTGWTCGISGQTVTCTRTDSLSVNSSYPTISVFVTVAQNAAASLTNTVTVAGGGEANVSNDNVIDPTNIVSSADLSILKSVSDATPAIGSTIAYTLNLTNAGPTDTTGVTVKDLLPSGLTFVSSVPSQGTYDSSTGVWTVGNLPVGSASLTINAQVTGANSIVNKTEVTASSVTDPDSVPGDGVGDDAASVTITPRVPDLSIAKSHTGNFTRGSSASYVLKVSNSSVAPTFGLVTVADTLPVGLTPSAASGTGWACGVSSGQTVTCTRSDALGLGATYPDITINLNVTQTAAASLTNTARVSGGSQTNTANDTSSDPTTIVSSSDVQINKTAPATITPGQNAVFTITLTNVGPSDATGVSVTDPLPTGLTFVSNAGDCVSSFPCSLGNLAVGQTRNITVTHSVPAGYTSPDPVSNTANVSSTTPDPDSGNNQKTATAPLASKADLSLTKVISGATPNVTGNVKYILTLTNAGPSAAQGVTVNDLLPAGLTFVSSNPSLGTYTAGTGNWVLGTVPVATQTLEIVVTVTSSTAVTNNAQVSASSIPDPDSTPNDGIGDDFATVTFTPLVPDLTITKTHTPDPMIRGSSGTYSITVTNSGTGFTTAAVTMTDMLPAGLTPGAATGTGWACTTTVQTVSCTRNTVLNAGSSYTVITVPVTVDQTAAGGTGVSSLTNPASVAGGGETNTTNSSTTDPTSITSSADVSMNKTGNVSASAGTNVTYNIVVTNNGPSDAVNLVVSDLVPTGLTQTSVTGDCTSFPCALGRLSPSATRNIAVTYSIPGAYTAPDPIVNTATAISDKPDPSSTNNTAKANTSLGAPIADLGLIKTDEPPSSTAIPGTVIAYKITVTNAGPSAATGANVLDNFPATITGVTWTCTASSDSSCPASGTGNINATVNVLNGGTLTFLATGTIVASATGNLVNSATVTPPAGTSDPSSNNNADSNTLVPQADLSVVKTGPATITPGTNVVYTIRVKNDGPSNAETVVLNDPTPAGLTFVSNTGDCTSAFPCSFGNLAPNVTKVVTATYSVPASFNPSTTVTNSAVVSSPTTDPTSANNISSSTATNQPTADLSVTKTVNNASPAVGDNVVYTITLTNAGPSTATGVALAENLPTGLTLLSSSPATGTFSAGTWTLGTVQVGSTTLQLTARVDLAGALTNNAEVSASSTPDPDSVPNDGGGDDSATSTLTARVPDLTVTKSHTGNFIRGSSGVYTLTATNSGTAPTGGTVSVTDTLPAGLTPSSATGTGWSCSVSGQTVTCTRLDVLTAGSSYPSILVNVAVAQDATASLTNTANIAGGGEQNTTNNSATDPTSIVSSADLNIVKTAPLSIVPGQNAVFTIVVTNNGSSDAKNVLVSDPTPAGLSFVLNTGNCTTAFDCDLSIIPAGTSRTITATYSVPANYSGSSLSNTASLSSTTPDPVSSNNSSTVNVPVIPSSDLGVVKTAPSSITPGLNAVFTITVTNNGSSDAQAVVVSDPTATGLNFVSNAGTCTTVYPCNFASIPAGATRVITSTYSVPSGCTIASTANTASVISSTNDPVNTNNSSSTNTTLAPSADLSLSKVLTNPTPNLSENAIYKITLTNAGPSAAQNVSVNDKLPAGLTFVSSNPSAGTYNSSTGDWTIATVPVGGLTLDLVGSVTSSSAITNSEQVIASSTPDPDSTPNDGTGDDASSVTFTPNTPDLTISKSHAPDPMTRGSSGVYSLDVTNADTGFTTARVTVSDTLPAGLTPGTATGTGWSCTMAAQTVTCSRNDVLSAGSSYPAIEIPVTVAQTAPASLTNTANVSGGGETNTENSSVNDPTNIVSSADLRILKVGPSTVITSGSSFNYTIVVNNDGASDAVNVVVSDPLPIGLTFVSNAVDCTTAFPCSLGNIPAGSSKSITATYNVPASTSPTSVQNVASVSSDTPDPSGSNNSATSVTSLGAPISDLSITKTDGVTVAIPGTPTTYTITVSNAGPTAALGARVQDQLPTALTNASWTCSANGSSSCVAASGTGDIDTTANVQVGAANTVVYTLTGTVAANTTGLLVNTASVTPPPGTVDPSSSNNTDTDTLTPQADLSIAKTGSSTFTPGTNMIYTIAVTNAGPSNAADVSVTDPTPSGLTFVSSSGDCVTAFPCDLGIIALNSSKVMTVTYSVPANYAGATLDNTASVQSPTTDSNTGNNTASKTSTLAGSSDLGIVKTVNTATPVLGQNIIYNLKLSNARTSDASNITILEQLPAGLSFVSSNPDAGSYDFATGIWSVPSIAVGASLNLAITAKVNQLGSITIVWNIFEILRKWKPSHKL